MAISIPLPADRRRSRRWRVVAVSLAVTALAVGAAALSRSSLFHARELVVAGTSHLSRPDVLEAAGLSRGTNVLWLDEDTVERRLEAEPWIARAEVRSVYPRRIEIALVERSPVAVVTRGERREIVAADGTVLGAPERTRGLPRIELPSTPALDGARFDVHGAAAALGAMSPEVRAEIGIVVVGIDGTLDLRLRDGTNVRYGPSTSIRRKAESLRQVLAWSRSEGERPSTISVLAPDAPAVRLSG